MDLKRQLQVIEQEASVLRAKTQTLEADNEKLQAENKKLQVCSNVIYNYKLTQICDISSLTNVQCIDII